MHGALAAGIDRHLRAARQFADDAGVALGQRQRHGAGHRDDAEHLQLGRRGQRQQDGDGVVLTGIGVDDDRTGHQRRAAPAGAPRKEFAALPPFGRSANSLNPLESRLRSLGLRSGRGVSDIASITVMEGIP
jgi:hypothetical protein